MIIVMKPDATKKDIDHVLERIESVGLKGVLLQGTSRNVIAVIGDERVVPADFWDVLPGVERAYLSLRLINWPAKRERILRRLFISATARRLAGIRLPSSPGRAL